MDVFEVPRGKACDCLCPSCKCSLIARQGDINIWHFAHDHKANKKSEVLCEYAFWTSVQLMASQILSEIEQIKTPACIRYVYQEKYELPAGLLTPESRVLKTELKNVVCDAVFRQRDIDIGIVLDIPGKANPYSRTPFSEWKDWTKGILEIDLTDLEFLMFGEDKVHSFKAILLERIANDLDYKTWKVHRKEAKYYDKKGIRPTEFPTKRVVKNNVVYDGLMPVENNKRPFGRFLCITCDFTWNSIAHHQCPGCHEKHYRQLYGSRV